MSSPFACHPAYLLSLLDHSLNFVLGWGPLSLVDLDGDSRLVVGVVGKGLSLLGWDGIVPFIKGGNYSPSSLDIQLEERNLEKQEFRLPRGITSQDSSLDNSSVANSFVGAE